MFFVLTKRAVKVARDTREQYAARTTTHLEWLVSGPFTKKAVAERAAAAALTTHSCLVSQVLTVDQMNAMTKTSDLVEHSVFMALKKTLKVFVPSPAA